jgi:hypothetical protein
LTKEVLEAHGLNEDEIDNIIQGEIERENASLKAKSATKNKEKNKNTRAAFLNNRDKDLQLGHYLLKRRLGDPKAPFSLKDTVYSKILAIGGTISFGTRAPKKVSKVALTVSKADDSKDAQHKEIFGNSAAEFDILLRDLHPMVAASDDWSTNTRYITALGNLLKELHVCKYTELIVYLRYDSIVKEFASMGNFVDQVSLVILCSVLTILVSPHCVF